MTAALLSAAGGRDSVAALAVGLSNDLITLTIVSDQTATVRMCLSQCGPTGSKADEIPVSSRIPASIRR